MTKQFISHRKEQEFYTFRELNNKEAILIGEQGEVWLFDKTPGNYRYKCYSENLTLVRQMLTWKGIQRAATYNRQDGVIITHDLIIPKRLVKRACGLLGVPLKKDSMKIEAGKQLEGKRKSFLKLDENIL